LEEQELIAKLKDPDTRGFAFDRLVRLYQRTLYYHIRRLVMEHEDADDILQNTFLKAWKNIEKFRGDASIKTWLYRIATNESFTFLNKKKKYFSQDLVQIEDDIRHSVQSARQLDGDEIAKRLKSAIQQLPDKQRVVFNMRYFDELKYEEMSAILETSVGALKASYHHAVKKIERYITAD
jgi:RNA polymerase sigma-70 factor (ECF subfamily)